MTEPLPCPYEGCGRTFPTGQQGLTMHIKRAHEGFNPNSGAAAVKNYECAVCGKRYSGESGLRKHTQNRHASVHDAVVGDVFSRLGKATDALFPDGVPSQAVIKIAEWQKVTLKMLADL